MHSIYSDLASGLNRAGLLLIFLLSALLLNACAIAGGVSASPKSQPEQSESESEQVPRALEQMLWNMPHRTKDIDPALAQSRSLSVAHFYLRDKYRFGSRPDAISKQDYALAVSNADSGHAYDAFLAALAYHSGYFKSGKGYSKNNRSISPKGRDFYAYRHYLRRAARLGSPEANVMLVACGFGLRDLGHERRRVRTRCLRVDEKFGVDMSINAPTARMAIYQAIRRGKFFDRNFAYVGESIDPEQRLSKDLEEWKQSMQVESIEAARHSYKDPHKIYPASVAARNCKANLPFVLHIARDYEEPVICQGKQTGSFEFVHYSTKLDCPGAGYGDARSYLDSCLALTESKGEWDYLFEQRMSLYHPRADQELKFIDAGIAHYQKTGDSQRLAWVQKARAHAAQTTMENKAAWDQQFVVATQQAKRSTELHWQKREAERLEEQRQMEIAGREAEIEARREAARAQANKAAFWKELSAQTANTFNDDIDRMKDQAMRDINAQQQRLRTSRGSTSPSETSRPPSRPSRPSRSGSSSSSRSSASPLQTDEPEKLSGYEAEKQNCLNAGKRWNKGCDYSTTVEIQGWKNGNRATVQPASEATEVASAPPPSEASGSRPQGTPGEYGGYGYGKGPAESATKSGSTTEKDAWAYCWETKSGNYYCDGPLQLLVSSRDTLQRALEATDCHNGKQSSPNWYHCGRKLKKHERVVRERRGVS